MYTNEHLIAGLNDEMFLYQYRDRVYCADESEIGKSAIKRLQAYVEESDQYHCLALLGEYDLLDKEALKSWLESISFWRGVMDEQRTWHTQIPLCCVEHKPEKLKKLPKADLLNLIEQIRDWWEEGGVNLRDIPSKAERANQPPAPETKAQPDLLTAAPTAPNQDVLLEAVLKAVSTATEALNSIAALSRAMEQRLIKEQDNVCSISTAGGLGIVGSVGGAPQRPQRQEQPAQGVTPHAEPAAVVVETAPPPQAPVQKETEPVTLEALKKLGLAVAAKHGAQAARDALSRVGAQRLKDVLPEHYGELKTLLEAAL